MTAKMPGNVSQVAAERGAVVIINVLSGRYVSWGRVSVSNPQADTVKPAVTHRLKGVAATARSVSAYRTPTRIPLEIFVLNLALLRQTSVLRAINVLNLKIREWG